MNSLKLLTWNATGLISSSSYLCDSLKNHDIDFCGISEHYITHVVCDRDLLLQVIEGSEKVGLQYYCTNGMIVMLFH